LDDLESSLNDIGVSCHRFDFTTEFSLQAGFEGKDIQTLLEWISLGRFSNFSVQQKNAIYDYIDDRLRSCGDRIVLSEAEVALVIPDDTERD
jgi:hypothetical protein